MSNSRPAHAATLLAGTLALAGCAAPAVVLSAGLSAAQQGAVNWTDGQLVGVYNERFDDVTSAVEAMARDLSLKLRDRRNDGRLYVLMLEDDAGVDFNAIVRRRTDTLTVVTIRVGFWGNKPVSSLVLSQMEKQLGVRRRALEAGSPLPPEIAELPLAPTATPAVRHELVPPNTNRQSQ